MVERARQAGFASATARLLSDWVTLGLVDKADRRGLGRGVGSEATWPHNQLQLFLTVLDKRHEAKQIATLCNIPVAIWLWWGDEYVPLRQTRRAMETWAGAREHARSWRAARTSAEQLVGKFAQPNAPASARKELIDLVAKTAMGRPFNGIEILNAFRRAFDPTNSGRTVGRAQITFRPESYVSVIQWRLTALAALKDHDLDDDAFQWARHEYLVSRRDYQQHVVPALADNAEAADAFLRRTGSGIYVAPTFEEVVNQACVDLLTVLGIHIQATTTKEHTTADSA